MTEHALLSKIIAAWPDGTERARASAAIGRALVSPRTTGGKPGCVHGDLIRHIDGTIECGHCGRKWGV